MSVRARRAVGAAALAGAVAVGLAVHTLLPDTDATDMAGDALYAVAAWALVVLLLPRRHPVLAGAIAAAWCVAIELFQLTGVPETVGAAFSPAMLVLGTVFDARDLWIYIVTIGVLVAVDVLWSRTRRVRP